MPVGFYELLQLAPEASPDAVRAAWQDQVAQVVRRMRTAEAKKLDRAPIEARRLSLNEAYAVLSDPVRRRRYDRFRAVSRDGLPTDPDELWRIAGPSLGFSRIGGGGRSNGGGWLSCCGPMAAN